MTDAELRAYWPDLALIITELRALGHSAVADRLIDAVRAGATSSEILGEVGLVLQQEAALRLKLSDSGSSAWKAVTSDVARAFPGLGLRI